MQLQNKQSPWKNNHDNWKKKRRKTKGGTQNKQTKMIKNKPKRRIKANQHHKQLGLSKTKQQTVTVWSTKTSVKVIWHNKHWQMKKNVDG